MVLLLHNVPSSMSDGNSLALSSRQIIYMRADYLLHLLIFMSLMILVWLYLNKENITGSTRLNYALLWFAAVTLFAAFAEGIHYFLPYRSFNPVDLLLNVTGVILGSFIFLWQPRRYSQLK